MQAKRFLAAVLAAVMLVAMMPTALAVNYPDTADHWASAQIAKWSDYGVLKGNDGVFRPDANITRGEMAVILDRLMVYQTKSTNSFADLDNSWYTDSMLKANAAGIIKGGDGAIRPKDNITRQEAAVMLCRALGIAEVTGDTNFADNASIATWAKGAMKAMSAKGLITGVGENRVAPTDNITRASVVKMLDNAIKSFYNKEGEYTANVTGTVVINTPNVTLKNMTVTGDLIIAEGVGEGDVTLNSVTVTGNTIVRGGGSNTVKATGDTKLETVRMEKLNGDVRIVTTGNAVLKNVLVNGGTGKNIIEGKANKVTVATGTPVTLNNAKVQELAVEGSNANIVVGKNTVVDKATVTGTGNTISGEGKVTNATVSGNNTSFDVVGTNLKVDSNVTGTTSNDKAVSGGSNVTTTTDGSKPSTGTDNTGGPSYKYYASATKTGNGTVSLSTTATNTDNTAVTVTVTPDAGWVLKTLTVKKPGATTAEDILSSKTFTMDVTGSYTVTATFEKPLADFGVAIINSKEVYQSFLPKAFIDADGSPDGKGWDNLATNPWLAIKAVRTEGYTATYSGADIAIQFNGQAVTSPNWTGAGAKDAVTAYVNTDPTTQNGDILEVDAKAGTFKVTMTYEGATYTATVPYTAPDYEAAKAHTVTFKNDNGTADTVLNSYKGQEEIAPTPEKTGYTFEGWYTNEALTEGEVAAGGSITVADANLVYYAKWTANEYTIKYDGNNNTAGTAPVDTTATYDKNVVLATNSGNLVKTGYTFAGWNTKNDGTGTAYAVGASVKNLAAIGNVTLFAQWAAKDCTLAYNLNYTGAPAAPASKTVKFDAAYGELATPTRTGYALEGWYKEAACTTKVTAATTIAAEGTTTIYAKWTSVTTIEAMSAGVHAMYKADNAGFNKDGTLPELNEFGALTFAKDSTVANKINVTGSLNYIDGFVGFNASTPAEQHGYYAVFQFAVPDDVATTGTIITRTHGDSTISRTASSLDTVDGVKYYSLILIMKSADAFKDDFQITVDWDGTATGVVPTTYTVDFSAVTKNVTKLTSAANGTSEGFVSYTLKNGTANFDLVSDKVTRVGVIKADGALKVLNVVPHTDTNCPAEVGSDTAGKMCMLASGVANQHDKDLTVKDDATGTYLFWTADGIYQFDLPVNP